jgi:Cu2+-exporting ATPase
MEATKKHQFFPVLEMSCASCASSIESYLKHLNGVQFAQVNYATQELELAFDSSVITLEEIKKAVVDLGYDLVIQTQNSQSIVEEHERDAYMHLKRQTFWAAIFTFPVFIIGMFFMHWEPGRYISFFLSIPVIFFFGGHFYRSAWKKMRKRTANMDTLVALSTLVAFIFSVFNTFFPDFWHHKNVHPEVYYESATVIIVFVSLGKMLEEKAKNATSLALKKLMNLQPKRVIKFIDGKEVEVKYEDVLIGDVLLVKSGQQIPVDGVIETGASYVNESSITGESLPIYKEKESKVFAGTLNLEGSFTMSALKVGDQTVFAGIIRAVKAAQNSKAPVQKTVDKIASIFVPIVIVIALITLVVWTFSGVENAFSMGIMSAVSVLVIACPCALGLATPTAIMVGIGQGATHNLLIRNAEVLEKALEIDVVVLDKTGTITEGKPQVKQSYMQPDFAALGPIFLAMEKRSDHPLAQAINQFMKDSVTDIVDLEDFQTIRGKGIVAKFDGVTYFAGNQRLMEEFGVAVDSELKESLKQLEFTGHSMIYFGKEGQLLAYFGIADTIKESSKCAIDLLRSHHKEVYMLTGDNQGAAENVAKEVGIIHVQAQALPEDKAHFIEALQASGKKVAMIGDGINDSQAMALADSSIAMGKGSDIAMDVADVTIISSDLAMVPKLYELSRKTVQGVRQNLFWAFIYNLIGIPIAAGILFPFNGFLLSPMLAGGAMALSSVSVVLNSLRLNYIKF